jgi:hypothetical protein
VANSEHVLKGRGFEPRRKTTKSAAEGVWLLQELAKDPFNFFDFSSTPRASFSL